ncbi:MAG: EAL domain-containing protein [Gammaproteobacteria bacterium]|nr:EAL domain-containing protein [Gammaproteobacteria bacterium]
MNLPDLSMENDQPTAHPTRILVIDDDMSTRLTLVKILQKSGYMVEQAVNGEAGLHCFKNFRPDLVLLDVIMPIMDGYETCQAIRQLPGQAATPILMLTGLDDVEAIDSAFAAGATDFITKPINWPLLIRRVRYALRTFATAQALNRAQLRQHQAQEIARLGFWEWRVDQDRLYWSSELLKMFGLPPNPQEGQLSNYLGFIPQQEHERITAILHEVYSGKQTRAVFQHPFTVGKNAFMLRVIAERDGKETVFGVIQDITDIYETKRKLEFQHYHDALTNLANRRMFTEQLEDVLARNEPFAVISLDIDRFSLINDTLGHKEGDKLLQMSASRISGALEGQGLAARMGTDEFSILLPQQSDSAQISQIISQVQAALAQPFRLGDQQIHIETSAGIALAPQDGQSVADLLNAAVKARLNAKKIGGIRFVFFDPEQQQDNSQRLYLENELRKALGLNQFRLFYQPQVDVQSNRIIGVEALIRWQHPEMGMVSPDRFIPIVEELELVHEVGDWIAEEAVRQAKEWHDKGLNIRVGANLSAQQFTKNNLAQTLHNIILKHDLPPSCLDLEITESIAMQNPESALSTLNQLKSTGASLAIDDFGTGYSSLEYLQKFPVDLIKIDRAFIKNILVNPSDQAIVRAILGIAESMGMRVIAEGVEQADEMALLKEIGCHEVQGYFVSRPLDAEAAEAFIVAYNAS